MAKAKSHQSAEPAEAAPADNDADSVSSPQPPPAESSGGGDPGLGVAGPEEEHPSELPRDQKMVQLSGGWTDREGNAHAPGDWVIVDEQTANDLNTAGYVMRNSDGTPRTAKQAAEEAAAQREAAKAADSDEDDDEGDRGRGRGAETEESQGHRSRKSHTSEGGGRGR